MDEKIYWYWLSLLPEIECKKYRWLINRLGAPSEIYKNRNNKKLWQSFAENTDKRFLEEVSKPADFNKLKESLHKLYKNNIYFITENDVNFPKKIKELDNMPCFLYYKGRLPAEDKPSIAIIGKRNCTEYGSQTAVHFARRLAQAGVQVISGMARGIDGQAHRGALQEEGCTYAILGNGIDICYPPSNRDIYENIQKNGGIISEHCPGRPGLPYRFPLRNRIISALSDGIFVIEAGEKSGTLITVAYGLEQGKDIYALPGRVTDKLSRGCNKLITEGAMLVSSAEDIIRELELKYPQLCLSHIEEDGQYSFEKKYKSLACDEKIVYSVLSLEPKYLETIQNSTNLQSKKLIKALINLELKGYICQPTKDYYVLNIK